MKRRSRGGSGWWLSTLVVAGSSAWSHATPPPELETVRDRYIHGAYAECLRLIDEAGDAAESDEAWVVLEARGLLALGRYPEAAAVIEEGLDRHETGIRVRLTGWEAFRQDGRPGEAAELLREIDGLFARRRSRYSGVADRLALGRTALLLGADPRQVLELFYDRVEQQDPDCRETYLAGGFLALDKHDDAVAATTFQKGLARFADDPDMHYGLARAYRGSDEEQSSTHLAAALTHNPNHVPARLLMVDRLIDAEQYSQAEAVLAEALDINPAHPEAWAYRAVLAHLANDTEHERSHRATALRHWPTNPAVDHLIGRKLSQKYRFAEGAACQRRALGFDPSNLLAKVQLAQDLLRLGDGVEGWALARQVHEADAYDVVAYNLVTLHDTMAPFRTLTDGDFIVRMERHEAELYGPRVLDLLHRAKETLCAKYAFALGEPVTVEIFPAQKDFAVRTFGMPGGEGFLGVCFGKVITANSPASQGPSPSNWEAVLWHEFCHVVTLGLTRNKMPRWLSEGISVYEERQADATWGERMTPHYRRMILEGELTPIGELSGAFLSPPSPRHLQFAYYESSLVVEFLIDRYGLETLVRLLAKLGEGTAIHEAMDVVIGPRAELEADFQAYAVERAESFAPDAEWDPPTLPEDVTADDDGLARWVREHPAHVAGLEARAGQLLEAERWVEAKAVLERLIALCPGCIESGNAYGRLARVHRRLDEPAAERQVLEALARRAPDATEAYLRLMELAAAAEDWPTVGARARSFLAVQPLLPQPYRHLARSAEALDRPDEAIQAYRSLLQLEPMDPADVHYRLARRLHEKGDPQAKRHVLMALEEAPRFRDAQRLLLAIRSERTERDAPATPPSSSPAATREVSR